MVLVVLAAWATPALATDPPHNPPRLTQYCLDCHTLHNAPGATLTAAAGNHNLCMSCHNPTGLASPKPFASADQAVPGVSGNSHRFDALAVNTARETLEPLNPVLASRLQGATSNAPNKRIMCSTCHDQHSQQRAPPDQTAPAYGGAGTGWGRHYQRIANDADQACLDCHRLRDVQSSAGGSHPVRVPIPSASGFQAPATLHRINGNVSCTTCHSPHYATSGGANDGYLLDDGIGAICYQCHTLGDAVNASHLKTASGVLWPGGQYGSTRPAAPASYRGYCVNCHWPHGQRDDVDGGKYLKLWAERYDVSRTPGADPDDAEDLCFTCHDGAPATTNLAGEFAKGTNTSANVFHHAVKDSEQLLYGRSVECVDCHNPHLARSTDKHKGVAGVDLAGNAVGFGTGNPRDITQYELCFKCHGNTRNTTRTTTNKRLDFQPSNSAFHPVVVQGQNQSAAINQQLQGGLSSTSTIQCADCHNNEATRFANGTSTPYALGPASNSTAKPKGPHGAVQQRSATQSSPYILRAYFNGALQGPATFNADEFRLCFLCHGQTQLMSRDYASGARTNFYDPGGRDNLHWLHLDDRSDKARATCKSCHFNIHSNRQTGAEGSAHTTQYRINGGTPTVGPPTNGVKTRNVAFASDVQPGSFTRPEFALNTTTRQRSCNLQCHGYTMNFTYTPSATYDTDALTYTPCTDSDGDTYFAQAGCGTAQDCNDGNAAVHPGASEGAPATCVDTLDNDCDGQTDCQESACFATCCHDADGDTFYAEAGCGTQVDCNDANPNVKPGAPENTAPLCSDTVDNDCDSATDCSDSNCMGIGSCPSCTDGDGDTYYLQAGCGTPVDCNDANPAINPGVAENTAGRCADALDNDCDGQTDCADGTCASFWTNADGDAYYSQATVGSCQGGDCLDSNANVNPGMPENTCALCRDTLNNNCASGTDLTDPACAQQLEDTNTECSNGADNDGDGAIDCHDRSCWTGAQCGGGSASNCVSTAGGNNRNCCRPAGTAYACYRSECNGQPCDRGGTCDVY